MLLLLYTQLHGGAGNESIRKNTAVKTLTVVGSVVISQLKFVFPRVMTHLKSAPVLAEEMLLQIFYLHESKELYLTRKRPY